MPEELSLPKILPVGAILFQTLFLLIAIAIEGYVLHRWLKFDKKTSIFYAIAINVFSTVIGWNFFFLIEPILPLQAKSELMSYVFFNRFTNISTQSYIIFICFVMFFATFLIKFSLLKILIITLDEIGKKEEIPTTQREKIIINEKFKLQNTNLVTTTLIANSMSYSAITVVLILRNLSTISK
ncbi:filament integrity protein fraC [Anabaena cylindrica UHCC 0172]|uniref:filament integrity protein FraC n=1 Tax=Anabaena cylindrica TaxID=1165 RepID=UPI002B20B0A7|nr:filament integrity protein FraC [Anabaena cylindrica]MEA5550325.1 filament integrity protein fraC [Anabaena cylindrica UHCC 0172]